MSTIKLTHSGGSKGIRILDGHKLPNGVEAMLVLRADLPRLRAVKVAKAMTSRIAVGDFPPETEGQAARRAADAEAAQAEAEKERQDRLTAEDKIQEIDAEIAALDAHMDEATAELRAAVLAGDRGERDMAEKALVGLGEERAVLDAARAELMGSEAGGA